jgi:hypothetical protein
MKTLSKRLENDRQKEQVMEDTTYTLHIRQLGEFEHIISIPEIGVTTQATATLDSALTMATNAIKKHLTARYLVLVYIDEHVNRDGLFGDPLGSPQTELERQAAYEVVQRGIAPSLDRRERHLLFALSQTLTREQARWLDEQTGKLFYRYFFKDEFEVMSDALMEEIRNNRKAATNE